MPSIVVPKLTGVSNVTPSLVCSASSCCAVDRRPSASTNTRCTVVIVTGLSGRNRPSVVRRIHPSFTATFAQR